MESVVHGGHLLKLCGEAELQGVVCGEKQGRRQSSSSSKRFWAYRWCYDGVTGYLHVACMKIVVMSWEQDYEDGVGGGVVEASVTIMEGMLRRRSPTGNTGSDNGVELGIRDLENITKIVEVVSAVSSS